MHRNHDTLSYLRSIEAEKVARTIGEPIIVAKGTYDDSKVTSDNEVIIAVTYGETQSPETTQEVKYFVFKGKPVISEDGYLILPPETVAEETFSIDDNILMPSAHRPKLLDSWKRGVIVKRSLLDMSGGLITLDDACDLLLDTSPKKLREKLDAGQILGHYFADELQFPMFQFSGDGDILPGLEKVLLTLPIDKKDFWQRLQFFVSRSPMLDNTPIAALRAGHIDDVLKAANGFGEQGGA